MISAGDKAAVYRFISITAGALLIFYACLLVLGPFVPALFLAVILTLAAWPGFKRLERRFGGRRGLAAGAMTALFAVCFLLPLLFLGASIADDLRGWIIKGTQALQNLPEAAPDRLVKLPLVGDRIGALWSSYADDRQQVLRVIWDYAGPLKLWLLHFGASVGHGIIDVTLAIVIAFFLFRHGPEVSQLVYNLMGKFGGRNGQHLLIVSRQTIVGVVYGIIGAAVVEGILLALGCFVAHVPGAALLGFVTMLVSVIPIGFPLVWLPVAAWLFFNGSVGWGIAMVVWGAAILGGVDLFMRPYFISSSSKLPLLLVVLGVFGGVGTFGLLGLFAGPTLLAVAYVLITELSKPEDEMVSAVASDPLLPPA